MDDTLRRSIEADCLKLFVAYGHALDDGESGTALPRPMPSAPMRAGDYLMTFVKTGEGWRIARAAPQRAFGA